MSDGRRQRALAVLGFKPVANAPDELAARIKPEMEK
jgi:hypothetical protein